jgi:hypothetical protein
MNEKTATELGQIHTETIRMYSARQSATLITHRLERFIPDACWREAHDALMEAFYNEQMELTSIQQRLEMEAVRNTMLRGMSGPLGQMLADKIEGKK